MKILSTLAVLGLLAGGAALSQQEREGGRDMRGMEVAGDPDKFFALGASMMNLAEVAAGRLAEQSASHDDVKEFGRRMVKDHTEANSQLARWAEAKGMRMPARAGEAHSLMVAHLGKLKGAEFDQEFVTLAVASHAKAVALFEAKSKWAKDADLKAWAGKMLPVLKEHHEMAKELQQKVSAKESK